MAGTRLTESTINGQRLAVFSGTSLAITVGVGIGPTSLLAYAIVVVSNIAGVGRDVDDVGENDGE